MRSVYKNFIGKPEGKIVLGTPRSKWGDSIEIDVKNRV
jgi:hypothetical protein